MFKGFGKDNIFEVSYLIFMSYRACRSLLITNNINKMIGMVTIIIYYYFLNVIRLLKKIIHLIKNKNKK